MEIFLLIVLICLVVTFYLQTKERIQKLEYYFDQLKKELAKSKEAQQPVSQSKPEQPAAPVYSDPEPETKAEPVVLASTPPEIAKEEIIREIPQEEKVSPAPTISPNPVQTFFDRNPPPHKRAPQPTFFERNPDLEKFIGENLINKIGIAILVLGIGFFVKYAIDKDWINEYGRAGIGILSGGILLGFAHYLRVRFQAFSSVLVGGGISVLYFTIGIAFHEYHLLSQTAAFAVMVGITAFSIVFALGYDRIELAVLSIIGGFSTPFMVSTGEGNYIVLFSYLMILNVGMLTLAYFKKWNLINILSYVFTIIIYGGWMVTKMESTEFPPYTGALLFGTLFYLTFFAMNIINNIKEGRTFNALDFSLLLSNTFLYYGSGMYILNHIRLGYYEGMFTAALAVFNFIFAFFLYKNHKADKNLVYLLIGLVLSFASLTAPIQLEGNHITLFWAAETVLLLWLSQRSGIRLMKIASCIVMVLMTISLIMDWNQLYFQYDYYLGSEGATTEPMLILLNKGFITGVVVVISKLLTILLLKKENDPSVVFAGVETGFYKGILNITLVITLYFTLFLELNYQLFERLAYTPFNNMALGLFNSVFLIGLYLYANRKQNRLLTDFLLILGAVMPILFILYYNQQVVITRDNYLEGGIATMGNYLFHYLATATILVILALLLRNTKVSYGLDSGVGTGLLWFCCYAFVHIVSAELCHLCVMISYSANNSIPDILDQVYKMGFPILWGVCSFILMALGMRLKMKHLRIISLSLFFITLLKLFIYDIQGISEGGKIAAFISLGVILLVVSFMYQRLKVLILEDDAEKLKNEIKS